MFHCSADRGHPVNKLRGKQNVRVVEHAVFQRNDYKLRTLEMFFEHFSNVFGVGNIECGVDFVQDVQWRRFEE